MLTGLGGLVALVASGLYPDSMVGIPGDRVSNMAPPTFVIVALLAFQAGFAEVIRPAVERRLLRPGWDRFNRLMNRYALVLFLFHASGMALARAVGYALSGGIVDDPVPDLVWWLERPLAVLAPLALTLPLVALVGKRWVGRRIAQPVRQAA
jgi:hypothetical protein